MASGHRVVSTWLSALANVLQGTFGEYSSNEVRPLHDDTVTLTLAYDDVVQHAALASYADDAEHVVSVFCGARRAPQRTRRADHETTVVLVAVAKSANTADTVYRTYCSTHICSLSLARAHVLYLPPPLP